MRIFFFLLTDSNNLRFLFTSSLTPVYEIVTSGDESYFEISSLLEKLKNALMDIDDLRNEPIITKIQGNPLTSLFKYVEMKN